MRTALLLATVASLFPSALAETDAALPLGVGSTLYWHSHFDGSNDTYVEKLIAEGSDFQIYLATNEFSEGGPSDYFALFSGIDFRSCDEDMPTPEERAAVAAMWPLETGKSANIFVTSDNPAKVEVGNESHSFLMGRTLPAHYVTIDYENNDEVEDEKILVLDDTPLTSEINWSESSRDTLTLVTKPRSDTAYDVSEETIGTCAALLTETQK